ncbi:acetate uptake transporter [Terrabacter lapilli]|uniref:Acetate uptake transporter n=1 Tax=Terrabacter lapilli TaxID=436231 RepID=A0ABN2RUP1_9MICO|nr:acetate uptake transporter [Terrabacter sp.]
MSDTNITTPTTGMTAATTPLTPVPAATTATADPAPLGLAAFAMTTMALSVVNAGILNAVLAPAVLGLALFYGGGTQLLAGMWEFRRGNTFGAVAFSSFGAFWLSYWFLATFILSAPALAAAAGQVHQAIGLYLLGWTIFTAYMTVASFRVSGAVAAVFVLLTLTFAALCIGAFLATVPSTSSWTKIGGWLGLATALAAWYASFAGVTNETFKRTVVPTWPMAPGAHAR